VVILMQENRSFDHYSGTMAGVRGFNDLSAMKLPNVNSVFQQPYSGHPDGFLLPFRYNAGTTNAQATPGLPHDWSDQHDGWNHGKMDNWIPANGPQVMGYYSRKDIPFHFATTTARCSGRRTRTGCSRAGHRSPPHPGCVGGLGGALPRGGPGRSRPGCRTVVGRRLSCRRGGGLLSLSKHGERGAPTFACYRSLVRLTR
jgi:hypothetical protein